MAAATSTPIVVLGSTGSIGRNVLDVVSASPEDFTIEALSAHSQVKLLAEQARRFRPQRIVVTDEAADLTPLNDLAAEMEIFQGGDNLCRIASGGEAKVVVAAIMGSAGLRAALAALEAGKTLALANKETLVAAGGHVLRLLAEGNGSLIPIDSEHSAIFQALQAGNREDVVQVILTASGGPFRDRPASQMAHVTVDEALNHPNWDMGTKITIDSATMMNKALEVIEARWLFDLRPDQIEVVIHPQSIIHSMVEFVDGSIMAQMGAPDMRIPIQYALTYPRRQPCPGEKLSWKDSWELSFQPADRERFPALDLGFQVARDGGTAGVVLNAANECAVAAFLAGEISFIDIVPACRGVLEQHNYCPEPSLDELLALDGWARREVRRWVCE
ncbi:MAG: 1-deoxy-D-xylulose-5-phosphate reductoisomerase [Pirellulales bacterium]|nr:1-deoxy-D-xylulose-5-phosphate reductoisomerase [Pirellulales bacterium]